MLARAHDYARSEKFFAFRCGTLVLLPGCKRHPDDQQEEQFIMAMIETQNLTKTFSSRKGPVEAVRGVDLRVNQSEIYGFLGPNGAGKTTTMRMLSTLLDPT